MEDRALVRSGIVRRLRPLPCKKLPALQRLPPRRKRQTPRGVGELSSFLKVERQRRDAREVVACAPEDEAEEHRAASLFSRLLEGLDVSRPFGDGKSLGRLALERGALHFLAAWLRAGGEWRRTDGGNAAPGCDLRRLVACRALIRGWPENRAGVARYAHRSCDPAELGIYLREGDVGVRLSRSAKRRTLCAYVALVRRAAARGALRVRGDRDAPSATKARQRQRTARLERFGVVAAPAPALPAAPASPRPRSPRATTPRSRTRQIMRRCGTPLAKARPRASPRGRDLDARNEDDDLECSVCLELPTDPVLTVCGHLFCHRCLRRVLLKGFRACPMCRGPLPIAHGWKRCGRLILERLTRLRGLEHFALRPPFHPCLAVHAHAARCSERVRAVGKLGDDMRHHAPLAEIRERSTQVFAELEAARLALGVAIMCHPDFGGALFRHVAAFV